MPFELGIALRYLLTRRKHSFISIISLLSIVGVALGVAALIVVLGVMNGFSTNLRDKILGVNAHLIVSHAQGAFTDYAARQEQLASMAGVSGVMPFLYSEVMLSTPQGVKGAALRGIQSSTAAEVLSLEEDLVQGSLQALGDSEEQAGIIIGQDMASRLGSGLGDQVNMLTPSGEQRAFGFTPKIKVFRVAGIFDTGMYEYDSSLAFVSIKDAQEVLGFERDAVTGLEIRLDDVYKAPDIATEITDRLGGFPFVVRTWMDMNRSLFSALKLEKTAMAVILVMIVLVGSFSIITTLIMLVMEKKQDVAVLMSMGCLPGHIRRIFMWQGSIIGFVGTALGYAFGLGLSYLLETYQFIKLPQDIYYLDHLPVLLNPLDLTLIGLVALLLCFLATLYPANQAAKVQPAQVLRYE
jgi:lipoprotein-releasing system permease protein